RRDLLRYRGVGVFDHLPLGAFPRPSAGNRRSDNTYLGKYGCVESREKYRRVLAEYLASSRAPVRDVDETITVSEAMVPYVSHVDRYYIDPVGRPTYQILMIRLALKVLRRLYGETPARDFGPLSLKACRAEFVGQGLSRTEVNRRTRLIVQFFRWCVS